MTRALMGVALSLLGPVEPLLRTERRITLEIETAMTQAGRFDRTRFRVYVRHKP